MMKKKTRNETRDHAIVCKIVVSSMEVLNQHACNIGGFVTSKTSGMRLKGIVHVELFRMKSEERRSRRVFASRVKSDDLKDQLRRNYQLIWLGFLQQLKTRTAQDN